MLRLTPEEIWPLLSNETMMARLAYDLEKISPVERTIADTATAKAIEVFDLFIRDYRYAEWLNKFSWFEDRWGMTHKSDMRNTFNLWLQTEQKIPEQEAKSGRVT